MYNPLPPPPPQGVNGALYFPNLYASSEIDISKCIEGRSITLTILVDYVYYIILYSCICSGSRMNFRVANVIFYIHIFLLFFFLVKAKPKREPIELPI